MATRNVDLIIDCLSGARDGKLSTIEIRDHINSRTKYGTTSSELKALMSKQNVFMKDGTTLIKRPSGCYKVDMWKLNRELMKNVQEKQMLTDFEVELLGLGWVKDETRFSSAVRGAREFLDRIPPYSGMVL